MHYKPKSLGHRCNTNKWECVLEHTNPITSATETTYHIVEGKTRNQAERARNELIVKLELEGFCASSGMAVSQFMQTFLEYKISSKTLESSTSRGYRGEIKMMCKYIGAVRLYDLTISVVNEWMATMSQDDYAPKSVDKCFRLLKQALNYAIAQDLLTKNPCNFCKPPKRVKTLPSMRFHARTVVACLTLGDRRNPTRLLLL